MTAAADHPDLLADNLVGIADRADTQETPLDGAVDARKLGIVIEDASREQNEAGADARVANRDLEQPVRGFAEASHHGLLELGAILFGLGVNAADQVRSLNATGKARMVMGPRNAPSPALAAFHDQHVSAKAAKIDCAGKPRRTATDNHGVPDYVASLLRHGRSLFVPRALQSSYSINNRKEVIQCLIVIACGLRASRPGCSPLTRSKAFSDA